VPTVIYGDSEVEVDAAERRDGDLWLPLDALYPTTGWDVRPEGVCAGDTCVPLPPGAAWWDDGGFNLSAFARHLGQPEAADDEHGIVAFMAPSGGGSGPGAVEAPDFTLPDLDGNLHSLSDHRGKKVVLLTWASW
jgi:hypothetical protein